MTNFEKIKNMSVDEMAEKLDESFACDRWLFGQQRRLRLTYYFLIVLRQSEGVERV